MILSHSYAKVGVERDNAMRLTNHLDRDPDKLLDDARVHDVIDDMCWQVETGKANSGSVLDEWARRVAARLGVVPGR